MAVDFKEKLQEQLGFLHRSSILFDQGFKDEGLRIATTIRVLIHDTKNSTSLLKHLKASDIKLSSTVGDGEDDDKLAFMAGGMYAIGCNHPTPGTHFVPACRFNDTKYTDVSIKTWINQSILQTTMRISRRDIYLGAANKDGGAHVDKKLSKEYDQVKNGPAVGYITKIIDGIPKNIPVPDVQYIILRQMAAELLSSKELLALCSGGQASFK